MVADNPDCKIELKGFHAEILNSHSFLGDHSQKLQSMPVVREITPIMVQHNFNRIKNEVQQIIENEMERVMGDPAMGHLIVKKNE